MIAKHVAMKSIHKSNVRKLIDYITYPQQKTERVGEVSVTNCYADQAGAAALEMFVTQAQNRRATSDKTYHLIVSFRAGEEPDAKTLKAIEARLCEGLGFGEHQRISAVHYDTDNLHLHIAINKIHPERFTIHNPYYDHKVLAQLCEKLEQEYKLDPDNHQPRKTASENRVQDMERHSGVESLIGWIKRKCLEPILAADSWEKLHKVLAQNGLEIRERANGLIITDGKTMVKASSVSRDLSKAKLEARLGPFRKAPELSATKPLRRYDARPVRMRIDTSELYARYKAEQERNRREGQSQFASARNRKSRAIESAKRAGWLKRSAIKLLVGGGISKKALYALASKGLKDDIQKIVKQYATERAAIQKQYRREAWLDWLKRKATEGDSAALAALRAREVAQGLKGNTVTGQGRPANGTQAAPEPPIDSITKEGTIIYRSGASAIRDDGTKLAVSLAATPACLEAGLRMAIQRYGTHLTVTGSNDFKEQVVSIAAKTRLSVTFSEPALEMRRRSLAVAGTLFSRPAIPKALDERPQNGVGAFAIVKRLGRSLGRRR